MNVQARTAVLLDRHPLWLDAVERVLDEIGIRTIGKTILPAEALSLVEGERPDVFITSVGVRDDELDGLACLRRAQERQPGLRSIVLSGRSDTASIEAALDAGAVAYVIKTAHPDDLRATVRQAFDHSVFLAGARRAAAPAEPVASPTVERSAPDTPTTELTRRELQILQLVAEGNSNAQVGRALWVTEQTVKFHLSNIYRKLGVSNRTEAGRWAQVHGLLTEPSPLSGAA